MNPICESEGCYMFGPGTEERAGCEGRCRLEQRARRRANLMQIRDRAIRGKEIAMRNKEDFNLKGLAGDEE